MASDVLVRHTGGCHCGAVKFEIYAPAHIHVLDCNCSICKKKQLKHLIIPASQFNLLSGENHLTTYVFNTRLAQHKFCKICGVESFYIPRSNPEGISVMPNCLDESTIQGITVETFDGINWEESYAKSSLKKRSKV